MKTTSELLRAHFLPMEDQCTTMCEIRVLCDAVIRKLATDPKHSDTRGIDLAA